MVHLVFQPSHRMHKACPTEEVDPQCENQSENIDLDSEDGSDKDDKRCDPLESFNLLIDAIENKVKFFIQSNTIIAKRCLYVALSVASIAYLIAACAIDFGRARIVVYLAALLFICLFYSLIKNCCGHTIHDKVMRPMNRRVTKKHKTLVKWTFSLLFVVFAGAWVIRDSVKEPLRLVSLAGIVSFVFIGFLFSTDRGGIRWRPVLCGFALQFVLALIILRTEYGFVVFKWMGDRVIMLLKFSQVIIIARF